MGKTSFAPGFRFKPTDVELLKYYLKRKLMGKRLHTQVIAELDIYKFDPWVLPDKCCLESGDLKWYFFCPREKKYRNGNKIQRATDGGYWKATGKDRSVLYGGQVVGWIKTLIFHIGRAPKGDRTDWVMHEYRLEDQGLADEGVSLESYVLCMIFQKEGLGPKNGAQYGVPFKEEDWLSDDEVEICSEAVQVTNTAEPQLRLPCNNNSPTGSNTHCLEETCIGPTSGSCISDILPSSCKVLTPVCSNYVTLQKPHASSDRDNFRSMFDGFTEENTLCVTEIGQRKAQMFSDAVPIASMPYFMSPTCEVLQPVTGNYATTEMPHVSDDDEINSLLNCFTEESALYMYENGNNEVEGHFESVWNTNMPEPDLVLPNNYNSFITTGAYSSEAIGVDPSFESCRFDVTPPSEVLQPVSCNYGTLENPHASNGDDILPVRDCLAEKSTFLMNENGNDQEINNLNADATPHFNTSNGYEDLGDWGNLARVSEVGYDFSNEPDDAYMELCDLE